MNKWGKFLTAAGLGAATGYVGYKVYSSIKKCDEEDKRSREKTRELINEWGGLKEEVKNR
jgi:uncharacterized membrane protein YebE (DUF533 family)